MAGTYTHICVILDRSGSMESIRDDTIGGFNAFVEKQMAAPGAATLSLIQFDSQDPFEVLEDVTPIQSVPKLTRERFVPRSGTPLLDCIGRTINYTEEHIAKMASFCRPDSVIVAIVTDGQENASHEFKRADIMKMIEDREKQAWKFVFLSADLRAVQDAVDTGISRARTLSYPKTSEGTLQAWNSLGQKSHDLRSGKSDDISFEDEEGSDSSDSSDGKRKRK